MGVYTGDYFLKYKNVKIQQGMLKSGVEKGANEANQVHTFKVLGESHSVL